MYDMNKYLDDDDFDALSVFLSIKTAVDYIALYKSDFKSVNFNGISVSSKRTDDNKVSTEVDNMYNPEFSTGNLKKQLKVFKSIYTALPGRLSGYFSYHSSMIDVLIDIDKHEILRLKFTDSLDIFQSSTSDICGSEMKNAMVTNVTDNVFSILKIFGTLADMRGIIFNMLLKNGLISNRHEVILQPFTPSQARLLAFYYILDYNRNHGAIDIFEYKPLNKELEQLMFLNELASVTPDNMVFKFGIFRAGRGYVEIDNSFEVSEIFNYLKAMTERLDNLAKLYPPKHNNCYAAGNYTDRCFIKMLDSSVYVHHSYAKSYYTTLIHSFGEIASKRFRQVVITYQNSISNSISVFYNGKMQYYDGL